MCDLITFLIISIFGEFHIHIVRVVFELLLTVAYKQKYKIEVDGDKEIHKFFLHSLIGAVITINLTLFLGLAIYFHIRDFLRFYFDENLLGYLYIILMTIAYIVIRYLFGYHIWFVKKIPEEEKRKAYCRNTSLISSLHFFGGFFFSMIMLMAIFG